MSIQNFLFAIYIFYHNFLVTLLRLGVAVLLLLFFFVYEGVETPGIAFVLFVYMSVNEIFIFFKVFRSKPSQTVDLAKGSFLPCLIFRARADFAFSFSSHGLISKIESLPEIVFVKNKIGNVGKIPEIQLSKEELLSQAGYIVQKLKGKYITEVDLYVAYLQSCEQVSKILETNELKSEDVLYILGWARKTYDVEQIASLRPEFKGLGYGEFLVYGWHYEIKKYGRDLTSEVLGRRYEPILVGRDKEYESLVTALCKESANNVIIVGEPGTGATVLVESFTYRVHMGDAPTRVSRKKVYEIMVDRVLAGVASQGELAERLDLLFEDVSHSGNAILFIPNIENIFGGGGFAFDVSGVLYEYVKSGSVHIIGTTTPSAFKKYVERQEAVLSSFELLRLDEPDKEASIHMVLANIERIERAYNVEFSYKAILSSVELSSSYLLDSYLPGKAVALLESVASEVEVAHKNKRLINDRDIIAKIERKTHVVLGHPDEKEREMLLAMEDIMHKRIIDQEEAIVDVSNALRRLRSGFKSSNRPISVFLFLGPTGVGKTETAKVLASLYFTDEKQMLRLDMSEFQTPDSIKRLLGSLPGEEEVTSQFIDELIEHPFTLVLLDEFEKAHSRILDIFLQVFDDGILTDNQGRRVSFSNTIIIATSNAGSEMIRERIKEGRKILDIKRELLEYLQREKLFKPELLNRFDDVVVFKPLSEQDIFKISQLLLIQSLKLLEDQQITLSFDESVIRKISTEAFSPEYGARNVRRYLTTNVESMLSTMILKGELKKGDHKKLTVESDGRIAVV